MSVYSIIKKSELEGALRLDAEYYQPEYLDLTNVFKNRKAYFLKDVSTITTGPAYSSDKIGENFDIPLARIGDITNKIDSDKWLKLSQGEFEKFKSKKIKNFDILMTMTGDPPDVGKCNIIDLKDGQTLSFNQRVAKISSLKNPFYLFVYLSSEIVRLQSERTALGIRQRNVGINDIRNIKIIFPNQGEISSIEGIIRGYLTEKNNSRNFYSQAEQMLLEELGLEPSYAKASAGKDFEEKEDLFSIVKFSDVKKVRRMDAEYFQPKYEKLISRIKQGKHSLLGDLVSMKKGMEIGAEQYQEEGEVFIRVSSLSKQGIIDKDQKYLSDDLYLKLKTDFEPKVGEILLTKDATPGIAYVLKEKVEGIISSGTLRLKLKQEIEAEYLALFINSVLGQMQAERDAGGSIISHWKPEQVKNLIVPILPQQTQQKIAELVTKSHQARQKAKELLAQAKLKVEKLIEL